MLLLGMSHCPALDCNSPLFRRFCAKLFLKAETQQVDRILEEFSRRYWDCNPGGLFGSSSAFSLLLILLKSDKPSDIVHAVAYSILLLNTDLHVAELTSRMSRSQFVRNTMATIQAQLRPGALSSSDLTYDDCSSSVRGAGSDDTETISRSKRSDSIRSWNSISKDVIIQQTNGSNPSVQGQVTGRDYQRPASQPIYGRGWEDDMESLLKVALDFYPFFLSIV